MSSSHEKNTMLVIICFCEALLLSKSHTNVDEWTFPLLICISKSECEPAVYFMQLSISCFSVVAEELVLETGGDYKHLYQCILCVLLSPIVSANHA